MVIKVFICRADLQWNIIFKRGWRNCFSQSSVTRDKSLSMFHLDWFYMLFDHLCRLSKASIVDPSKYVENSFRCRNDVEGGRYCAAVLKVWNPEFASSELPFCVSFFLKCTIIIICFISGQWGSPVNEIQSTEMALLTAPTNSLIYCSHNENWILW